MTLVTKSLPGKDPIRDVIQESYFSTNFGGGVGRMMRDMGHPVLIAGWNVITVPAGGSVTLEWVGGE